MRLFILALTALFAAAAVGQDVAYERDQLEQQYVRIEQRYEELEEQGPPDVALTDPLYVEYEQETNKLRRELHGLRRFLKMRVEELTTQHVSEMKALRERLEADHKKELEQQAARHEAAMDVLSDEIENQRSLREEAEANQGPRIENNVNVGVNVNVDNSAIALEMERLRMQHELELARLRAEAAAQQQQRAPEYTYSKSISMGYTVQTMNADGRPAMQADREYAVEEMVAPENGLLGARFATFREYGTIAGFEPGALTTADEMMGLNPALTVDNMATTQTSVFLYRFIRRRFNNNRAGGPPKVYAVAKNTVVFARMLQPLMVAYMGDTITSEITIKEVVMKSSSSMSMKLLDRKPFAQDTPKTESYQLQANAYREKLIREGKDIYSAFPTDDWLGH